MKYRKTSPLITQVWSLSPEHLLLPRNKLASFEQTERFPERDRFLRPLTVTGTDANDYFLFADIPKTPDNPKTESVGFVVTGYRPDLVIAGDLLDEDPTTWLDAATLQKLELLGRATLSEFGFTNLPNYLELPRYIQTK